MAAVHTQTPDSVQLVYDFTAPQASHYFSYSMARVVPDDIDILISAIYLARNCASVANSANAANAAILLPGPGPPPTAAVRLTKLLRYFENILNLTSRPLELLYGRLRNIAANDEIREPIDARWAELNDYRGKLTAYCNAFPANWASPGFNLVNNPVQGQPGVPSEGLLELLAQLWIWVARSNGADLSTTGYVQGQLRTMTESFLAQNGADYQEDAQKNAFSFCLFATTRIDPGSEYLLVGSTNARFVRPNIQGAFKDARHARIDTADPRVGAVRVDMQEEIRSALRNPFGSWTDAETELVQEERVRAAEKRVRDIAANEARKRGRGRPPPTDLPGKIDRAIAAARKQAVELEGLFGSRDRQTLASVRTRVITNLSKNQLRVLGSPPVKWKWATGPFDHLNQNARSHGTFPNNANQWFNFKERCLKCRVIYQYTIAGENLNTGGESPNDPLQCAEDVIHAKLRSFSLQNPPLNNDPMLW